MIVENKYKFDIGDIVVDIQSKLGITSEVIEIGEGFGRHIMKININNRNMIVYIKDHRLATEKELLQTKIKNIFVKK